MQTVFHKASERGYAKQGWLETHYSFSFAAYYNPLMMGFGALRVINDDTIAPGQGFGPHAHQNMEIITIPLSGALAHLDNMGNGAVIETGEVQVMSAGSEVEHSEMNASKTEPVSLLQIWIMTRTPGVAPHYEQKRFDPAHFQNQLSLVVGPEGNEKSGALSIHQDAFLSLGYFEIGKTALYTLKNKEHGVYIFVIEGQVLAGGTVLGTRDALGVWETDIVNFTMESAAKILLIEVPMEA